VGNFVQSQLLICNAAHHDADGCEWRNSLQDVAADSVEGRRLLEDWRLETATWVQPQEPEEPKKGK